MRIQASRQSLTTWLASAVAVLAMLFIAVPATAQGKTGEVDTLLRRLADSGCEFRRHGQWHDAGVAAEHLRMKHRYILRARPGLTTEEFIALGASGSPTTRQPYRVRCQGSAEQTGAQWMTEQLQALRAASQPTRPSSAPAGMRPSQPRQ